MPVTAEEPKWLYRDWDDEYVITAGSTGVIGNLYTMTAVAGRPTMALSGLGDESFPCIGLGSLGQAGVAGSRCEFRIHGIAPVNSGAAFNGGIRLMSNAAGLAVTHVAAANRHSPGLSNAQSQGANHRVAMLIRPKRF